MARRSPSGGRQDHKSGGVSAMNNLHLREGKVEFRWKRWRNHKRQEVFSCVMVLFSGMVLLGAGGGIALAGPTGGQVTSGTGTISHNGTTTTIGQAHPV